jgi:catechol 2,3-dioxygenase-like lactoylglutathione lyase family enzyme
MSSRLQLALNVDDIDQAIAFYSKLFGTEPAKIRPGYANFAIAEPPLKLVLLENPGQGGSLNHLGIEVPDTDAVAAEQARLAQTGLAPAEAGETTCCYAKQDKFWVQGTQRRILGDLHRAGRQPDLLRRRPWARVLRRDQRPHGGTVRVSGRVLLAGARLPNPGF